MPLPSKTAHAPRTLVRDMVYGHLLAAIVDGTLVPGEALNDKELESWLGASRTPIREALSRLSHIGLVEVLPQRITRVSAIDPRRVAGALEVMGAIYAAGVREAAPLLTDGDRSALGRLRSKFAVEHDLVERAKLVDDFFMVFISRYGNGLQVRLVDKLRPSVERALRTLHRSLVPSVPPMELDPILAAVVAGDVQAAAREATQFFASVLEDLEDRLAQAVRKENEAARV